MRLSFLLLSFFLFSLTFFSCQKEGSFDPSNPNAPAGASGNFKAKLDGVSWSANNVAGASRFSGFISIAGLSADHKLVAITLTDSGVHKYTLSDASLNIAAFIDSTEANKNAYITNDGAYPSQSGGEVNITAINTTNKTISGTFAFKVFRHEDSRTKIISEGSFTDLPYQTSLPAGAASDTLRVKLDGASWTPHTIMGVKVGSQIAVTATNDVGTKSVGLVFPSDIAPGTYELNLFGAAYIGQYNPDADPAHSKASIEDGTLTILEHNTATKRIRGSFSFKAQELLKPENFVMVSEGYFSVRYP